LRKTALLLLLFAASSAAEEVPCDPKLWRHVHHPKRLITLEDCALVRGTVSRIKANPFDGDQLIYLRPDPEFRWMLNVANLEKRGGNLVAEIICQHPLFWKKRGPQPACAGYAGNLRVPRIGERVEISGSYVLDNRHGWMEIHPVSRVVVLADIPEKRGNNTAPGF
jgi:hypothetical protein